MLTFRQFILLTEAKPKDLVDYVYKKLQQNRDWWRYVMRVDSGWKEDGMFTEQEMKQNIELWLSAIYEKLQKHNINLKFYDWFIKSIMEDEDVAYKFSWDTMEKDFYRPTVPDHELEEPAYNTIYNIGSLLRKYEKVIRAKIPGYTGDINKDFPVSNNPLKLKARMWTDEPENLRSLHEIPEAKLLTKNDLDRIRKKGAKLLDTVDGWKIYEMFTHEANCLYGSGTKWCTASKDAHYFDRYKDRGRLFTIISPENEKFQLFIPKDSNEPYEINDELNIPTKTDEKNPELWKVLRASEALKPIWDEYDSNNDDYDDSEDAYLTADPEANRILNDIIRSRM